MWSSRIFEGRTVAADLALMLGVIFISLDWLLRRSDDDDYEYDHNKFRPARRARKRARRARGAGKHETLVHAMLKRLDGKRKRVLAMLALLEEDADRTACDGKHGPEQRALVHASILGEDTRRSRTFRPYSLCGRVDGCQSE